jgi:histone deacetylase 6
LAFLCENHSLANNTICSYFTSDTYANGHSACAAKLAAGLCADLASLIVSGRVRNGFALVLYLWSYIFFHETFSLCTVSLKWNGYLCIFFILIGSVEKQVRPPGHHAGVKQAMGFCLHNNAAVAALAAKRAGAKKVLIVDWVMILHSSFVLPIL